MSDQPNWKNCKDCCGAKLPYPSKEIERISKENQLSCGSQIRELHGSINLSTLCDKCSVITPCSVCNKIISTSDTDDIRLEISNYNEEPICSKCKKNQCYLCGEEGDLRTWYGWGMCEECAMSFCNICDGKCINPCSNCEQPCDNCDCSDCSECSEVD